MNAKLFIGLIVAIVLIAIAGTCRAACEDKAYADECRYCCKGEDSSMTGKIKKTEEKLGEGHTRLTFKCVCKPSRWGKK